MSNSIRFGHLLSDPGAGEIVVSSMFLTERMTFVVETKKKSGITKREFSTEFLVDAGVIDVGKLEKLLK